MASRYCDQCGQEVSENGAFCAHCGHALRKTATPPRRPHPTEVADVSQPQRTVPTGGSVIVEKNSHPILTFIGGAVVLVFVVGVIANLWNGAPAPAAQFIATDVLTDENCTVVGDYCMRVHCTFQNTGEAAGENRVRAQLLSEDQSQIFAERRSSLTLLPTATQRLTFDFPEATIEMKTRARCSVDSQ